tara:strand:+ start:343 stop:771 length:429 start_codon:yes stop_codon:yes gene_type:complete
MNPSVIKLFISSALYSFTPLLEKLILKGIAKDFYLFIKYFFRFLTVIFMNAFNYKKLFSQKNLIGLKEVIVYLLIAVVLAFSSQYIYLDVLKNNDITFTESVGNVLINICSVLTGIIFLKEEITTKKIIGMLLASASLYLLT